MRGVCGAPRSTEPLVLPRLWIERLTSRVDWVCVLVCSGVWFRILQAMSIMSVVTNCVHIAFTSTQLTYYLPFIANQNRLVLTFVFEVRARPICLCACVCARACGFATGTVPRGWSTRAALVSAPD